MSKPIQFSDNNHWRFGWGKGLYNFNEQYEPFWCSFGPCQREPKSFDLEVADAARRIADNIKKPLYVAMSGGLDSELVARILLQEKIPFTPVIVQFDNDLNKQDIAFAFAFCEKNGLTPTVLHLDILEFFKGWKTTKYILTNCAHLMQMYIMRRVCDLGGAAIIAVGEQRYKHFENKIIVPVPQERIAVTHFMQNEQVEGVSAFYCYTPEMMLSIVREAKEIGFATLTEFAHNIKEQIYRKYWPDMTPRPKYSGFEEVGFKRQRAQEKLKLRIMREHGSKVFINYAISLEGLEKQLAVKT